MVYDTGASIITCIHGRLLQCFTLDIQGNVSPTLQAAASARAHTQSSTGSTSSQQKTDGTSNAVNEQIKLF